MRLQKLSLTDNSLSGNIPSELFERCTALKFIYLDNNTLEGSIPNGIGGFKVLEEPVTTLPSISMCVPPSADTMRLRIPRG